MYTDTQFFYLTLVTNPSSNAASRIASRMASSRIATPSSLSRSIAPTPISGNNPSTPGGGGGGEGDSMFVLSTHPDMTMYSTQGGVGKGKWGGGEGASKWRGTDTKEQVNPNQPNDHPILKVCVHYNVCN